MGVDRPSDRWDNREKKMVDAEIGEGEEPEKEKVEVVTEEKEEAENSPTFSGLYCIYCHDYAIHIYQGNSLCHPCFAKEMAELIKNKQKGN